MRRFRDPQGTIYVDRDEVFTIELSGNPTAGYTWQAEFPAELGLISHEFEPEHTGLGAGGCEVFRLHSRQAGVFEIGFTYRRPWAGSARDARRIRVVVGNPP